MYATKLLEIRTSRLAAWVVIASLLAQQMVMAGARAGRVPHEAKSNSVLGESGSAYVDQYTGIRIVRITDWRDGDASVPESRASSFNSDSSRFLVNINGAATVYDFNSENLAFRKSDLQLDSLQTGSCHWSSSDRGLMFGLDCQSGVTLVAYNLSTGVSEIIKDFSELLGPGRARLLTKALTNDDRFAFAWESLDGPRTVRDVVVWERGADAIHVFDLSDPVSGVSGFREAHLDRTGEALIVNGGQSRVWRYRSHAQADVVNLEPEAAADHSFNFSAVREESPGQQARPLRLPQYNTSIDARFVIFNGSIEGRTDVFVATRLAAQADAFSSVEWTNLVNCDDFNDTLRKVAGSNNSDDAYATSMQTADGDTSVEFTVPDNSKERWCGLNNSNQLHQSTSDINFALRLTAKKKVIVVENGLVKAKTRYKPDNLFRIAVESGVVNYYKNGAVLYTSSMRPQFPLSVNASLVSLDSTLVRVKVAAAFVRTVVSITPSKASVTVGETKQFTALVIGAPNVVTWSASQGSITSTGLYTAPPSPGLYTVSAVSQTSPTASASAYVTVSPGSDRTPPIISQIALTNISADGATISWSTNEASDSQVQYGTTVGYGSTISSSSISTTHNVVLNGLSPGTLYHFKVRSKDIAGNAATSADLTFTTAALMDTTPPVINAISVSNVSQSGARIGWSTNEPSDTQVEYGTSTSYGVGTGTSTALVTSHIVDLAGLLPNSLYHYRVKSRDASGNLSVSADSSFNTSSVSPPTGGTGTPKTDYGVYPEPAPPALPRAGGTFVDPVFGTTIMRVTDENDGAFSGTNYSYWQSFNKNNTRLYVISGGVPTIYSFDAVNFRISNKRALYLSRPPVGSTPNAEDSSWSGTDPDLMYGHDGLRIWTYNVANNAYTLIADLGDRLPAGYLWQMSKSVDDNVFAFTVKNTNGENAGYCAWRRDNNSLISTLGLPDLDEVQVDKSGQYLVVKTGHAGAGVVRVQIVNLQTRAVENLVDGSPDYAPGHSDNGSGFVIGGDNWLNRFTYRRLSSPHQLYPVIEMGNDWSVGSHVSMLEDDDSWMLMSTFVANSLPSSGVFRDELLLIATDGSKRVRRFAHTHSVYREYWDTPRATISRDGRFAVFTSNWGSTTRRDVFIAWVPGSSGTTPPPAGDTTPPVISAVVASGITARSASVTWTTNESADTQVEYGLTAAYGSSTTLSTSLVTGHTSNVSGLTAGTLYHYRVKSRDASGNLATSSDFTFSTSASSGGGGGSGSQAVIWSNLVNCVASGNSLQKNAGYGDTPDAGARGQVTLTSGDGYLEFTATETNKTRFCGLTHAVSGTDYAAIDFSIKLNNAGVAEVRENNLYRKETGYATGDVFRIAVEGGVVNYYKNGNLFYTSTLAPSYPLIVDASMIGMGATVSNAMISATGTGALASSLETSLWQPAAWCSLLVAKQGSVSLFARIAPLTGLHETVWKLLPSRGAATQL